MSSIYNGMPAKALGTGKWRTPGSGETGGNCIAVMKLDDGRVALRQDADPEGPALIATPAEIRAFINGVKNGEADYLL